MLRHFQYIKLALVQDEMVILKVPNACFNLGNVMSISLQISHLKNEREAKFGKNITLLAKK